MIWPIVYQCQCAGINWVFSKSTRPVLGTHCKECGHRLMEVKE